MMDRVIVPKVNGAATYKIPEWASCKLSTTKLTKPNVVKTKAVESSEGTISREMYQTGDFVSIDQYSMKISGCL